jgi:hypothetical protein
MRYMRSLAFLFLLVCSAMGHAQIPTFVYSVANIAALRAGNFSTYPNLLLSGFRSSADGGEGDLVAVPSDTTSGDNSCTIYVDAVGTRFYRLKESSRFGINFYQCGAYGDGIHNDSGAIQAAISAVGSAGTPYGGQYARVICPAGSFLLNSGVVISPGQRIELVGQHVSGVAGCQIKAGTTGIDMVTVEADAFRMDDVWLFGGNASGSGSCLVLGGSRPINDTTISNSWISNCSYAGIKIVNGQGIFIDNTTIEIVYGYGIYSNISGTSHVGARVTVNGSTFYKDATAIQVTGTGAGANGPSSDWNITGGSDFQANASASTCNITLQNTAGINISGDRFRDNANHDVCATSVNNVSVTNNSFNHGYGAAVLCSQCTATTANNNNGSDMWLGKTAGTSDSAIFSFSGGGAYNVVADNIFICSAPHAQYGLRTDSTVTQTGVGPNMFGCNTVGPQSIGGTTAWSY